MKPSQSLSTAAGGTDLRERLRLACEDAFLPYLRHVLAQSAPERQAHLRTRFDEHMDFLTDFCLRGYPGAGGLTVAFIQGLHRAMFPPGYRQEITTREGEKVWMVPGEFKTVSNNVCDSYLYPGRVTVFLPAEQVPAAMEALVAQLNQDLSGDLDPGQTRDVILFFALDFAAIHPFVDSNGRVVGMLADLLALHAGLGAFHLTEIKSANKEQLFRAVELAIELRDLSTVYAILDARDAQKERAA